MSDTLASTRRVVIADDEPLARDRLRMLLAEHAGYAIVAEAEDGASAVRAIVDERPDLVFLDIRMPELSGLEVADALEAMREESDRPVPAIVFVTAYDEHAVRAFELHAVDYLLKPADAPRMARALSRVEARLGAAPTTTAAPSSEIRDLMATLQLDRQRPRRFVVRDAKGGYYFVKAADVEWVEAKENYVALHANGRVHLLRDTMKSFEAKLDPEQFVRAHRSAIVNLDHVARLEPYAHGEYTVTLRDGTSLRTSKTHGGRLLALIR